MAQASHVERFGPGIILSVRDLEELLSALPAEVRASVSWSRVPIADALRRLAVKPLGDELLVEVARDLWRPLLAVARPLSQLLATDKTKREKVLQRFREDAEAVQAFLQDTQSQATFSWCASFVESLTTLLEFVAPAAWQELTDEGMNEAVLRSPELEEVMKAQAALLAVSELVRNGGDRGRAARLVDAAFVAMCAVQDALAREGLVLKPFRDESPSDRAKRVIHYASLAREALSPNDASLWDDARLKSLRE
jgi:hypothetical protein